jgi:predicted small metal-binding protein
MTRVSIDCRTVPSESGCGLMISGERDEVLRAAAAHAVDVHGHTDDATLRAGLESALRPETPALPETGAFVQVIEFRTSRIEDFQATVRQWAEAIGPDRGARWAVTGADRNSPGGYLQMVVFDDYRSAMANSNHPATGEFAQRLGKLCDGEPAFHDLDVCDVFP